MHNWAGFIVFDLFRFVIVKTTKTVYSFVSCKSQYSYGCYKNKMNQTFNESYYIIRLPQEQHFEVTWQSDIKMNFWYTTRRKVLNFYGHFGDIFNLRQVQTHESTVFLLVLKFHFLYWSFEVESKRMNLKLILLKKKPNPFTSNKCWIKGWHHLVKIGKKKPRIKRKITQYFFKVPFPTLW